MDASEPLAQAAGRTDGTPRGRMDDETEACFLPAFFGERG